MSDQISLTIVTPEKEVFSGLCDQVVVPAPGGPLGIFPHHATLMSRISPGELIIRGKGKDQYLAVGDGLVNVANGQVMVMADLAVEEGEIDEKTVEAAHQRAREALAHGVSEEEYATTMAVLEKSIAQLRLKRRHRSN